jgi:RNA polymerase sigma-70 factor (ECF subfamily)
MDPIADSDATLARRAAAEEADAFAELVRRHRPRLVRLITSLTGDADEAENLTQETLTRACAQFASFRTELDFGSWLHGIALNLCRNYWRARVRHARPVAPEHLDREAAAAGRRRGVLSGILRRETSDRTRQAIDDLPIPLREAFVLHFLEEMDYADMSRVTGVAAGTLRVRAHRARTLLRASLGSVVDTWLRESRPRADSENPS